MQYTGLEIYLFKDAVCRPRETPRSCTSQVRGLRNAERSGCRGGGGVSELGLLSKAWGGQNENLFANSKTRRCVEESKSSGLRRQRAVPKHNVGRNALCQGGRWVVATNAGERRKVHRRSAERQFAFAEVDIGVPRELWEKFKEMPPLFYTKTRRRRGSAAAYERLLGAQHTQAHARPKKAGWRPLSTKNPDVLAAA